MRKKRKLNPYKINYRPGDYLFVKYKPETHKLCRECNIPKILQSFSIDIAYHEHTNICKSCVKALNEFSENKIINYKMAQLVYKEQIEENRLNYLSLQEDDSDLYKVINKSGKKHYQKIREY